MPSRNQLRCTISEGDAHSSDFLRTKLLEYNSHYISAQGPIQTTPITLVLKSPVGVILGGLSADVFRLRARVYIHWLWVDKQVRGQGFGAQLMKNLEERALVEGCKIILLDTYSFQAPGFYPKLGYQLYGKIDDYPEAGISVFYYQKKIHHQ